MLQRLPTLVSLQPAGNHYLTSSCIALILSNAAYLEKPKIRLNLLYYFQQEQVALHRDSNH